MEKTSLNNLVKKSAQILTVLCMYSAVFFSNRTCFMRYNQPKENNRIKELRKF